MKTPEEDQNTRFKELNSLRTGVSSYNDIINGIKLVALDARFYQTKNFSKCLTIAIGRAFDLVSSDSCTNMQRLGVVSVLNEISRKTLNTKHFHVFMFEVFKVLKYRAFVEK